MKRDMNFSLNFRVPGWSRDVSVRVNGSALNVECKPGTWATISRNWSPGDQVDIRIPMRFRYHPIDAQHPGRVAVIRGPVVLALEAHYHEPAFRLPEAEEDLDKWLVPDASTPGVFRVEPPRPSGQAPQGEYWGSRVASRFWPFYAVEEAVPYFLYFDIKQFPVRIW